MREELDRCLDYRGNTALAGVTRCCLGCGVWQRQCHLRGRLSLGIISVSVTLVILPWAFANFADSVGSIGVVGDGGGRASERRRQGIRRHWRLIVN